MPEITIKNLFSRIINASVDQTIFEAIQENGIDWMHACGAKGRCTTCKFIVIDGAQHISTKSKVEEKYLELNMLSPHERLACQSSIIDDVIISVPKSGMMPHMNYND